MAATLADTPVSSKRVHPVDEVLPAPRLAAYGFQHVLAFYAGAVLAPILVANALGLTNEQLIHLQRPPERDHRRHHAGRLPG
jgi:xanthine/uracil permease